MITNIRMNRDGTGDNVVVSDGDRIRLAIAAELRSVKGGSTFRTSIVYVPQAFMTQFIIDIEDCCLMIPKDRSKIFPVVSDNHLSIVSRELVCSTTDIYLCETFILEHVLETGWGIVSRVPE